MLKTAGAKHVINPLSYRKYFPVVARCRPASSCVCTGISPSFLVVTVYPDSDSCAQHAVGCSKGWGFGCQDYSAQWTTWRNSTMFPHTLQHHSKNKMTAQREQREEYRLGFLIWLFLSGCSYLAVINWLFLSGWSYLALPIWLSYLAVLIWLSLIGFSYLAVLIWLS